MTVGTGGSPKNWSVWWCKCNKTPLFTVFSAHTQITCMLMLREHMPCLFATRGRFFMTFLDTFSSQHIETAKPRVFTRHALNCACLKNAWFYCARQRKWLSIVIYNESGALTTWQSAFFLGARESELPQRLFESICGRHQARHAFQGTWSSPHPTPPPTSCVASTMSASSRNVIITPPHPTPNFLRSINHVGKFKERDHHPTPPHPQLLA